jgi:hypothetical protein
MGKIADVTFTGASRTLYEFTAYSLDTIFKAIGAVYIFTKRTVHDDRGSHERLYIGQTSDLSERFENHEKWPCISEYSVNCICVHPESNEQTRINIETDLRNNNDIPCNKQ